MALIRIIPKGVLRLDGGKTVLLSGAEYVRQKLASRFRWWKGEWFLNLNEGVPYRREVFVVDPDLDVIRALFRSIVRSVVEVASVTRFDLVFDPTTRELSFDFEVTLITGDVLTVTPDDDLFLLTLQIDEAA